MLPSMLHSLGPLERSTLLNRSWPALKWVIRGFKPGFWGKTWAHTSPPQPTTQEGCDQEGSELWQNLGSLPSSKSGSELLGASSSENPPGRLSRREASLRGAGDLQRSTRGGGSDARQVERGVPERIHLDHETTKENQLEADLEGLFVKVFGCIL